MKATLRKDNLLALSSALFLLGFLMVDLFRTSLASFNVAVNAWAASINSNFFNAPARLISVGFDTIALLAATVVIAAVLFGLHHRRYSILLLGAMAGDALIVDISKILIASSRPINEIIPETNFSFPSGHVTGTIVFFGILVYISWKELESTKVRYSIGVSYFLLVVLVGFDRIYLNVHWLSDVIGAVFLGAFWLTFCIFLFNRLMSMQVIAQYLEKTGSHALKQPNFAFSSETQHAAQSTKKGNRRI